MWCEGPPIFDGEDEDALKRRFVELCAKYPDRSFLEIGEYTFKGLVDASSRGNQAGMIWSKELPILDAIDEYKRNGGFSISQDIITKEQLAAEVLAVARNATPKEAAPLWKLLAEMGGYVVKVTDNTIRDVPREFPNIVYAQYDD